MGSTNLIMKNFIRKIILIAVYSSLVLIFSFFIKSGCYELKIESNHEQRAISLQENYLQTVFQNRANILQNTCMKYKDKTDRDYRNIKNGKRIFRVREVIRYSEDRKPFLWCEVPKVGSTSWNILFINAWFPNHKSSASLLKAQSFITKRWQRKKENEDFFIKKSRKTFSFLITRHPFERALSGFRDKFLINEKSSEMVVFLARKYRKNGRNIVKKYRKSTPSKSEYQHDDVPSFREFIEYLLDQTVFSLNIHWIPIYNLCMPCHVNYDLIGRKETIDNDADVILKTIEIEETLPMSHVTLGKGSDQTLEEYFAELDKDLLERLYKFYEMDFLLFNYTIDDYYSYVTP